MDHPPNTASGGNTAPLSSNREALDDNSNSDKGPSTIKNDPRTIGVKAGGIRYVDRRNTYLVIIHVKKGNYYVSNCMQCEIFVQIACNRITVYYTPHKVLAD